MSRFDVREHVFAGQHIREYARATAHGQDDVLRLVAKQYIPTSNRQPQPGDVTILAAHANGFPKELYEPLWDDLLAQASAQGVRIRSIWMADVAWQGASAQRNEGLLGNDPSWYDHARDLLLMVNTFRADMPPPLVGIGHSFGGTIMAHLALLHPRLLTSLVLLDPVLNQQRRLAFSENAMSRSAVRRDTWPSRAAAAASFQRSAFYRTWDPRVLDQWVAYGVREVEAKDKDAETEADTDCPVSLTTSKHQEVFTFLRPLRQAVDAAGHRVFQRDRLRDIADDSLADLGPDPRLYRPEVPNTTAQLGHVRPSVCYVFGGRSDLSTPALRREKMALTGVGVGGSGGVAAGRVREVVMPTAGHLVAMEQPAACAAAAAAWMAQELGRWRDEEAELAAWWRRADGEKAVLDEEWQRLVPRAKL